MRYEIDWQFILLFTALCAFVAGVVAATVAFVLKAIF